MHAAPFLKWAGGKRWLAPKLVALLGRPVKFRFVEPFLGSGAAFFFLQSPRSLLADSNPELMAAFRAVRDSHEEVIRRLLKMTVHKEVFDRVRCSRPRSDVGRAVRLIYLNRTAFNGLYRVNRAGGFNVPFGCKPGTRLCDPESLRCAAGLLKHAELKCQDFRETLASVSLASDVLYVDPPYTVKHDNNGFRRYNELIFTWEDQQELAQRLLGLATNGAQIVVSNANHREIRNLYPLSLFHAVPLQRATCMAADPLQRGFCDEVLFVSKAVSPSRRAIADALAHT